MKKVLFLSLVLLAKSTLATTFTRVIKDHTHKATVTLTKDTIRCSPFGYGLSELKVTLNSLKYYAIFDHSNQDGLGPCITAGHRYCLPDWNVDHNLKVSLPKVLLNPDKLTEEILVRVSLEEEFSIFERNETRDCRRTLIESVETDIRGIPFTHLRSKDIGSLPAEECERIISQNQ